MSLCFSSAFSIPRRVAENPKLVGSSSFFTAFMKSHRQQFDSFWASAQPQSGRIFQLSVLEVSAAPEERNVPCLGMLRSFGALGIGGARSSINISSLSGTANRSHQYT